MTSVGVTWPSAPTRALIFATPKKAGCATGVLSGCATKRVVKTNVESSARIIPRGDRFNRIATNLSPSWKIQEVGGPVK
jgi:hypothetical protein